MEIHALYDGNRDRSFQYDRLNRLTYASSPFRSGSSNPLRYQYDALGNLRCLGASDLGSCQADASQLTYPTPGPNRS